MITSELYICGTEIFLFKPKISLLRPGRGAEYCDQFVCVSVCISVREHISGTAGPIFTKCFVQILCGSVAVAPSAGGVAICYVLPVLWMTSRLAVMGRMAMRRRLNIGPLETLRYRGGV